VRKLPAAAASPFDGGGYRRRRRSAVLAAAAVLATLPAVASSVATATPSEATQGTRPSAPESLPQRSPAEIRDAAIEFRAKFGLPYDDATLAAAVANPAPEGPPRWGVVLSPAEFAEMEKRQAWIDAKGPMSDAVRQRRDEFAGMWMDHHAGGRFVVMALPTASALSKAAVVAAAPAGAPVTFSTAEFSGNALDAAYKAMSALLGDSVHAPKPGNPLADWRAKGISVVGVGIETRRNRLYVAVERLDETGRRAEFEAAWDSYAASGALPPRQLARISSVSGAAPDESRFQSPVQMKGGLSLDGYGPEKPEGGGCTSNMGVYGGYVMTAAHCFGPGWRVNHDKHEISNTLTFDGWTPNSTADVALWKLHVPRMASRYMLAVFGCNNNLDSCQQVDKATGIWTATYDGEEPVCMGGRTTFWIDCGTVQVYPYTQAYTAASGWRGANTFTDQVVASYRAAKGDSGAVAGRGGTVHGVHSGRVGEDIECVTCDPMATGTRNTAPGLPVKKGWAVFSRMTNAQAAMGGKQMITTRTPLLFRSDHSGRCADVANNSLPNGTAVWSWSCNGGAAQQWSVEPTGTMTSSTDLWYTIKRYDPSTKCMDIDTNVADGAKVQSWDCNGASQQTFRFDKYGHEWTGNHAAYRIISQRTSKCVDVDIAGGGYQDGAKIQQWECIDEDQLNQYWQTR